MRRWLAIWLLLAALGWAQAWLGYERRVLQARIEQLEDARARLTQRIERLRLERAALLRPSRLRRLAVERFGMGPPRPDQVVRDE